MAKVVELVRFNPPLNLENEIINFIIVADVPKARLRLKVSNKDMNLGGFRVVELGELDKLLFQARESGSKVVRQTITTD